MTLPSNRDVHVNSVLTDFAVSYANQRADFKADMLAPVVPSKKQTDLYFKFLKEDWFRDEMKKRGPGGAVPMAGYRLTTVPFSIDVWSVGKPIDDQTRDNEDDILDSDEDATQFVMNLELIRREKNFAATCLTTGVWGTDVTGNTSASVYGSDTVAQWDDSDSHPLLDIAEYRERVKLETGLWPNVLVVGAAVWKKLKNHDDILERITGGSNNGSPAKVTLELVAGLMELEEVVVMDAVENTADEGQDMTGAFIAGKHGLLMHRNVNAGRRGATAVKTMTWQRPRTDRTGRAILKYPDGPHKDVVEVESCFAHHVCAADLGVFFNGLVG